jgi:glycosyltransferase involved in cell wall biosynthesis
MILPCHIFVPVPSKMRFKAAYRSIQLLWDPIKGFYPAIFLCLSQARWGLKQLTDRYNYYGIPLNGLTLPYLCACPKPGSGFTKPYDIVFFLCSLSWGERWLFFLLILVKFMKISYHNIHIIIWVYNNLLCINI